MTEQHRTTDIENLWLEWNKANQDLWNRMLQSWTNTTRQGDIFFYQRYLSPHVIAPFPA